MNVHLTTLIAVFLGLVLFATPVTASDLNSEDEIATGVADFINESEEATNDHPAVGSSCWCSAIKGSSCRIDSCPEGKVASCKGSGGAWPEKFPHWCSCKCK